MCGQYYVTVILQYEPGEFSMEGGGGGGGGGGVFLISKIKTV